jgi:protein phosphatase
MIDHRADSGPFDIIGDVHGCADELEELLRRLGYQLRRTADARYSVTHTERRRVVFVGDLVDRGPRVGDCLRIAMDMVDANMAFSVIGNHEAKVERWLDGRNVQIKHGIAATTTDITASGDAFRTRVKRFIAARPSHLLFDGGRLVVAHAGIKAEMQGIDDGATRAFCLYGDTTGESDELGLPVRLDWAASYTGAALVVYGHTPVASADWRNNTICIDTGCVFGYALTALRYPERELVSVPARRVYVPPPRPL